MGIHSGKRILVTGAGNGLGLAYAELMADEGAWVLVNDLGGNRAGEGAEARAATLAAEGIRERGGQAEPNFANVAIEDQSKAMIDQGFGEDGKLDSLVCNAGILRDAMIFNHPPKDWDAVIDVHLRGHYLPLHFAAQRWRAEFKETGEPVNASVVLTSSRSGLYGNAGQSSYASAKAGIAVLAMVVSRELGRYGVRVNAIAPMAGTRLTEMAFGDVSDAWSPQLVAPFVSYLCSEASSGVSGQVFIVGGGKVQWVQPWAPQGSLAGTPDTFTTEYVVDNQETLFGESPTVLGEYPTADWS